MGTQRDLVVEEEDGLAVVLVGIVRIAGGRALVHLVGLCPRSGRRPRVWVPFQGSERTPSQVVVSSRRLR